MEVTVAVPLELTLNCYDFPGKKTGCRSTLFFQRISLIQQDTQHAAQWLGSAP